MAKDYIPISEYNKLKEANGGKEPTSQQVSSYISARGSGASKTKARNTALNGSKDGYKTNAEILAANIQGFSNDYADKYNSALEGYNSRAGMQFQGGQENNLSRNKDIASMNMANNQAQRYSSVLSRYGNVLDKEYVTAANDALNQLMSSGNNLGNAMKANKNYWGQFSDEKQWNDAKEYDRISRLNKEKTQERIRQLEEENEQLKKSGTRIWNGDIYNPSFSTLTSDDAKLKKNQDEINALMADLASYNQNIEQPKQQAQRNQYLTTLNLDEANAELASIPDKITSLTNEMRKLSMAGDHEGASQIEQQLYQLYDRNEQLNADVHEASAIQKYNTYMQLQQAPDFEALSAKIDTDDERYNTINSELGRSVENDVISDNRSKEAADRRKFSLLSDEERSVYNYLYAKEGEQAAEDFLSSVEGKLAERNMKQTINANTAFATSSTPAAILSSGMTVINGIANGAAYFGQAADLAGDGFIDNNATYNVITRTNSAVRSAIDEDIKEHYVSKGHTGQWASFAYQTGMSMADFLFQAAVGGSAFGGGTKAAEAFTLAIMGTGAAANGTLEALDRGLSSSQAFTLGTIAGAAEIISEKISIEALFDKAALNTDGLKYILQNFLFEGSEEVTSDVINGIADLIVSKDKSQWFTAIAQYMAQGMSEQEAFIQAMKDQAEQIGMDFLGGAVSGGIMGVGGVIGNYIRNTSVGKGIATIGKDENGKPKYTNLDALANSLIDDAKSMGADTESGKVAADIEAKRAAGKKITMQDIGRLFESTTNAKSQALDMDENEYRKQYQAEIAQRRFENVAAAELVNEGKIKVEEATRSKAAEKVTEAYVTDVADESYRRARAGKDNTHYFLGTINDGKEVVSFSDLRSIEWDTEHGIMFEVEHEDKTKSDVPVSEFSTGEDIGDAFELARMVCEGSDITDAKVLSDIARTAIAARMAGNITSDQLLPGFLSIYGAARRGMVYEDAISVSTGSARASVNRMTYEQKSLAYRAGENAGRIMSAKDGTRNMGKGLAVRVTGRITKTMSQKLAALNDFLVAIGRHGSIFDNLQISDIKAEEGATILTWQDPSGKGKINAAYVKHKDGTVEYYFNKNSQDASYMFVAIHESLHDIRANLKSVNGLSGEQVYQKMLSLVSEFYKKQGVYNDMLSHQLSLLGVKDKKDIKAIMYDHANNSLLDAAQEEVVANALPAILANQSTMEQFALMVAEADGASRHAFERFIYNVKQFLAEALKVLTGRTSWAQLKAIAENQRLVDDLYALYEDAFTRLAKQNAAPSQMAGQEFTQAQANDIVMDQASEITEMPVSANREMYSVVDKDGKTIILTEEQIAANKIEIAQMENVYDVPVNNFKQNEDKDLLTMGKEYFASIGGSVYNNILGNVELSEDGLKHLIGQHLTWRKSAMIEAVPSVIANGKIIKIEENHKGYGFDSILIAAPARLENSDCIVGVAVKQNDKKENSYYVHEVYILNKERTTVGNSQSGSKTAANNDPIYRLLYSIEEIKRNLDNGNEISVEKFSYATYAEPDIKPGLTKAKATKTLGMSPEDITMVANTTNGKKDVVYASGRSVLEAVMKKYAKDNHMSPAMQKATLRFMDRIGKWMDEVAVANYHYIGLQDLNNAKMKIDWRNGKKVVLSARVKNGEYDVNFDLSKICKKRVAFSNFIDDLATRPGKNGKATMLDEIDLSPENIFKMNQILKDMGYETACLGCFVESRRYGIKTWAETIVNEWNARVDQIDPNAGYFDFAGGSTSADIDTISAKEIRDIDNYMKDFKQRVKDVGADVASEENKAKIAALEEEKKQRKAEISASKTMSKDEKKVARNQIDAEYNPQIAELKMNAQAKMLPLMQSDPRMLKKLRVGDLISSQGRTALHEYSAELESIVASRFGTSSPKSVEAFAPYNSEIALLPDTKSIGRGENKVTMTMGEYLSSIAGARSQSFSDFIISQVYDHLQKTADLAARGFKAHTYTKEIARAMLFGMTGEKINMSVMFDINPDVDWQYAGLEGNSMDSDYSVADYKHAAAVEGKTGEKQFTYSIPFAKAVEIEHNPLYSKDCGIIGVGHSYFGMLKMFRDERIPYIIGYHRSGMPEAIMKATHIELSADYTSVQNTLKFGSGVQFRVVNNAGDYQVPSYATWGGSAKKDVKASDLTFDLKQALADNGGDGRAAMQAFLDFMQDNSLTPNVSKAVPGHGSFDLYGDLEKTMDPNKTANNYIAWCINNNMVPMFYEFAAEPEYSKILFDFSVRNLANNGACSPQRAVSMDGLIALGEDAWESIASRFMKQYDDYMKEQFFGDKYEETLNQIYDSILADELRPYDMSAPQNASEAIEAAQKFSVVDDDWSNVTHDDKENARRDFETGNTTKVYRAMQLVDGKLYPPMAAVVDGKMVGGVVTGDIVVSDERPDLAILQYWDKDGKYRVKKTSPLYGKTYKAGDVKLDEETGEPAYVFQLVKGTKSDDGKKQTDVPARYNPYIHTSRSMINDQFSSAWKRSHLVTVEVEIPNSELTAGYWAEKAKDAVGEMTWKSGPVSGQLAEVGDPRKVILSRYCKIGAIIPTEEVAKLYADKVVKHGIEVPFNTVQPALRDELAKNGVKIGPPESGSAGKSAIPSYNEWAKKHADQKFSVSEAEDAEYMELATKPGRSVEEEEDLRQMVLKAANNAGFYYYRNTGIKGSAQAGSPMMMFISDDSKFVESIRDGDAYGDYHYVATSDGAIRVEDIFDDIQKLAVDFYGQELSEDEINPLDINETAGIWDDLDFVQYMWDNYFEDMYFETDLIPAIILNDGMIVTGEDNSRIKSLASVEYDDAGNIIPLSQRFNEQKEDIRFSVADSFEDAEYGDTVSIDSVENAFNAWNEDAFNADLASKVFARCHDLGITYEVQSDAALEGAPGDQLGKKVRLEKTYMNGAYGTDAGRARLLLHESIHACTTYAIQIVEDIHPAIAMKESENGNWYNYSHLDDDAKKKLKDKYGIDADSDQWKSIVKFVDTIDNIYTEIKYGEYYDHSRGSVREYAAEFEDDRGNPMYGLENAAEFVAELSNPNFCNALKQKNLLWRIVDAVCDFLGITHGEDVDAYTLARNALEEFLTSDTVDAAALSSDYRNDEYQQATGQKFSMVDGDPTTVTRDEVIDNLSLVKNHVYEYGHFPVRINTPLAIIYLARDVYNIHVEDLPMFMVTSEAEDMMEEESADDIGGNRMHGLDEYDVMSIIEGLDHPKKIVYQKNNGRFAEVVSFNHKGKLAYAVVHFADYKRHDNYLQKGRTGMEPGYYNILVTAFSPDDIDNYIDRNSYDVYDVEYKEKNAFLQGTTSRQGPYVLNRNAFYENIVEPKEGSVKMSIADTDDTRSVRDAIRENEKTLKLLAKLNGGDDSPIVRSEKLSRRQMNAIARELCEKYGSSAKYKEVADILYEAFGPIFDPSVEVDSMQLLSDAAAQIVDNVFMEGSGAAKLDEMLSYLNGFGPVMLSSAETQEIKSSFGTFNAFKSYLKKLGVKMQFRVYNAKEAGSAYMSDSFFADLANSEVGYLFPYEYDGSQVMSLIGELDKLNDHKLVNVYGKGMEIRENAIMEIVDELIARSAEYRSEAMSERISRQAGDVMSKEEEKRVGALAKQLSETAQEVRTQMERYQAEQKALNARTAEMVYEAYQEDVLDYEEQIRVLNEHLKEIRSLDEKRRNAQRKTEQALSELKSKLMSARDHLKARASSLAQMDAYYARELAVNVDAQAQMARAEARKEMAAKYKQQIEKLRNDKKLQAKDLSETMTAYNKVLADVTRQAKKDVRTARKEGRIQRSAEVLERDLRRNYRARIAARTKTMLKMLNGTANVVVPEGARNTIGQFVDIMSQQNKKFDKDQLRLFAQFYRDMGKGTIIGDEAQDLQNMFDEDIADRFDQLIDIIGGKRISDLTSDELRQTLDITNVFYHIARHADDVRRRGRSESMKKDAMSLFRQLNAEADRKDHGQILDNVEGFLVNNQTPYYFFKQAGGALEKYYQDIDNGVRQYTLNVQESQKRIQEIKDQFNYDEWSKDTEENRIRFEAATHRQVSLTRGEAMLIWATNKREQINAAQKADHLRGGGIVLQEDRKNGKNKTLTAVANRLTDENLQYIDNWLTPEQKACADALVQYLSADMAELGNEVTMQLYGIRKFDEPYYIPYNCAGTYLNKRVGTGAVNLDNMLKTISFTQKLTTRADAPILVDDIFNVASRHIERMTMYNALCIPLDNMNRLMNYKTRERIAVDEDGHPIDVPLDGDGNPIPLYNEDGTINADVIDIHYDENGNPLTKSVVGDSIRTMLTAKRGTNAVKYIDQFIDDMNGGANTDPRESFGSRMLSMFKKNAVMMSLSVAIQQPSAIGRAFALVDPKYFAQGMASKGSYEELKKYSYTAVLKEIGGFDTGTGRGIADWINGGYEAPTKTKQVLNKIDEVGGYLPGKTDELTWGVIWRAIKLETEAKNPDLHGEDLLRAAGARFDEVINATQVYDSTISRSSNMRSKTWYMKAATAFMAEPTVGYNLLVDAVRQGKAGNVKYAGRAVASFAVAALLNSILKSLVTAARKQKDDETYGEKYLQEFVGNFFSELNPFGLIPIAKDVLSIFDGYTVSRSDMDAIQDIKDAYDTLTNENKSAMDKINSVAAALSITTGVPVRNVLRDLEAVFNVFTNGIKNAGKGSGQGTRLALENAFSEIFPFSLWVKSSNKDYADRIIKDYKAGDTEAVEATIRDYQFKLDRQGKTAEDIGKKTESWIKKAVKEAYDAKEIDYDTAYKLLTDIGEIAEKVAFKVLQDVDYTGTEYEDSSSAYIGLYDAIDNNKDVEAAIKRMVKAGYDEKTVRQQAVSGILSLYKGQVEGKAKISKDQAATMLKKYGKLSADEAKQKILESNVYLTYGVEWTSNYSKLKDAYLNGNPKKLSKDQVIKILMTVKGYSRDKAAGIVAKW